MKLCECGCGQSVGIAKYTDKSKGWIKGQPKRFIHGHNSWKGGIHPYETSKNGHIHRILAEKALGKRLPPGVQIHHFNGNGRDNSNGNIIICEDLGYHKLLHRRQLAYEKSGHPDWRKCVYCKKYDDPKKLTIAQNQLTAKRPLKESVYHRECARQYQSKRRE